MPFIGQINDQLSARIAGAGDARVHYAYCGAPFMDPQGAILRDLMADGVHPGGQHGGRMLMECMLGALEAALAAA